MASKNVIEILIKATNDAKTKAAFKDLQANYLNIRTGISDALRLAGQFYDFAIAKTVDYAKSVRDLSQNLNITTEEASRLIQIADDYGVSVDQISRSLEMMTKNGVAPSVEKLAELSDKFLATQDPTERAAMATKLFGKSWADLTPILLLGGDALRKQADGVNSALVLTEKQVQAARDLEIQQDNLNDQWAVLSTMMGNRAIPAMTGFLGVTNALIEQMQKKGVAKGIGELERAILIAAGIIDKSSTLIVGDLDSLNAAAGGMPLVLKAAANGYAEMAAASVIAADAADSEAASNAALEASAIKADAAADRVTQGKTRQSAAVRAAADVAMQAAADEAAAAELEARNFDILSFALNGVDDATESQISKLNDLQTAQANIETEIQTAISQGYSPLSEKIQGLNKDLADNKKAQEETRTAIADTTTEMIYQQAAAGLDAEAALELARSLGVISEEDYAIATVLEDLKKQYLDGKLSAEQYAAKVAELNARVAEAQSKNVTITYDLLWNGEPPPGAGGGGGHQPGRPPPAQALQSGGPVYPWQSYMVGEVGPEMFRPATAGNIIPNNQINGGDINVTQNIYNPATAAVAMAQIRSLKAARINASMGV